MLSYRPEDWKNPYGDSEAEIGRHLDYEAGAEAMLEGLKENRATKCEGDVVVLGLDVTRKDYEMLQNINKRGWLVFIPDELTEPEARKLFVGSITRHMKE